MSFNVALRRDLTRASQRSPWPSGHSVIGTNSDRVRNALQSRRASAGHIHHHSLDLCCRGFANVLERTFVSQAEEGSVVCAAEPACDCVAAGSFDRLDDFAVQHPVKSILVEEGSQNSTVDVKATAIRRSFESRINRQLAESTVRMYREAYRAIRATLATADRRFRPKSSRRSTQTAKPTSRKLRSRRRRLGKPASSCPKRKAIISKGQRAAAIPIRRDELDPRLAIAMVASEVGHPRVRIGMGRGYCFAMECARAFSRFAIDCGELILGVVVERVLKTPLQITTPFGLVFEIPSRGASQRLFGREGIAIS